MTLRELVREFVCAKRRRAHDHDYDVTLAWRVGGWASGKYQLPELDKLLIEKRTARRQTAKEQVAIWQALAASVGGTFRPVGAA